MKSFIFKVISAFSVIGLLFSLPANAHDVEYDSHTDHYYDCYYDRHRHERVCYERRPPPPRYDAADVVIGFGLGLALHHGLSHYAGHRAAKHAYRHGGGHWRGRHHPGHGYRHHGRH